MADPISLGLSSGVSGGDLLAGGFNILILIVGFFIFIGGVVFVKFSGMAERYPYRISVFVPRAHGYERETAKGKYLKNGKFKIFYAPFDFHEIEAPAEEMVNYGYELFAYREARDSYFWLHLDIDTQRIKADPTISQATKVFIANKAIEIEKRFTIEDLIQKYAIPGAMIIFAIIFFTGYAISSKFYADALADSSHLMQASSEKMFSLYHNSTVVIYKDTPRPQAPTEIPYGSPAG